MIWALVMIFLSACSGSGYRTVKAVRNPFFQKVHAVGRLKAAQSINITPPIINDFYEFTITFLAPEGKEVKTGTPVLGLDAKEIQERLMVKSSELETGRQELEKVRLEQEERTDTLKLQLAEARGKLDKTRRKAEQPEEQSARIELEKIRIDFKLAQLNVELLQSKLENQTVSQGSLIRTQQNRIQQLENEVNHLQTCLMGMNVRAPKDGIVVHSSRWGGDKPMVGERTWRGETIIELPDLSTMQVEAFIPEPQAKNVKTGQAVEIRLDSNPERLFNGRIRELGRIFHTKAPDQPAMVFDAIITIEKPDAETMRPGMAAGIDIIIASRENVLQIPAEALLFDEEGAFVWKKNLTGKTRAAVRIGERSGGFVEIVAGLADNDAILIPNPENGEKK